MTTKTVFCCFLEKGYISMLKKIDYEDGLPVKLEVCSLGQYPWHTHNDIQIVYVLEGEIEIKIAYARYTLVKNNIHFIHNDDVHGFKGLTRNNMVLFISFNMEYFLEFFPDLDTQVFTTKVGENVVTYKKQLAIKSHIFSIISELYSKGIRYRENIQEISKDLISDLYANFRGFTLNLSSRTFEHKVPHDMIQIDRIGRVVSYIYRNYPYKPTLSEISRAENINSYYLSHLFQQFTGDSFRNFVSMARCEMSEAELLSTDASITQISQNVGFSNLKYYTERFREWFGCSPKEYRQLYRGEILGIARTDVRFLPLNTIDNTIRTDYGELPVFTGASSRVMSAGINFTGFENHKAALKKLPHTDYESCSMYTDYNALSDCIALLREVFKNPLAADSLLARCTLYDSPVNPHGLFTCNGLKKPLYYLCGFLKSQDEYLVKHTGRYMITSDTRNIQLLFFNDDTENEQDFEFSFFNVPGTYQMRISRIGRENSCIALWKQLNFNPNLTAADRDTIERISAPDMSIRLLDTPGNFTYSETLAPNEIVFVQMKLLSEQSGS